MKWKNTKLLCSLLAIVLCVTCLASGTYAWYIDKASASGSVDIAVWYLDNGNFSSGITGWKVGNGSGNVAQAATVAERSCVMLQRNGSKAPYVSQTVSGTYPAGTYTLTGKIYVSPAEGSAAVSVPQIEVKLKDGDTVINQASKFTFDGADQPAPAVNTWTDFSVQVQIGEGQQADELAVLLKFTGKNGGSICYDDIRLKPVA